MIRLFAINVEIRIFCIKFFHFTLLISTIINSPIQIVGIYIYINLKLNFISIIMVRRNIYIIVKNR